MAENLEWARAFSDIARKLSTAETTAQTLQMIAELATSVAQCPWAAITEATTDSTPVVAATNDPAIAGRIGRMQASGGGGPTWEAIRTARKISVPDLSTERRWPEHVLELLEHTPVRSIVTFCLAVDDSPPIGALTLYADRPRAFPPEVFEAASVYADHAAIALDHARTGDRADNLAIALETSREIGIAVGILIERHKITADQAFDLLRSASQRTHRKLRDLATNLAHTGELGAGEPV